MAEPGPPADPSAAFDGNKTVGVPQHFPTDVVELAWSSDDDVADEPTTDRASWRATWSRAGVLLLVGLGLAGAIVLTGWVLTTTRSSTKSAQPPPAPTIPTTASTPATAPSSIASTPDQDSKYVQALNDRGIAFTNPEVAIHNGKTVCQNIGQGMTVPQVVAAFQASSPAFSDAADAFVGISVRAYCPQSGNLVAGF